MAHNNHETIAQARAIGMSLTAIAALSKSSISTVQRTLRRPEVQTRVEELKALQSEAESKLLTEGRSEALTTLKKLMSNKNPWIQLNSAKAWLQMHDQNDTNAMLKEIAGFRELVLMQIAKNAQAQQTSTETQDIPFA